jgi:hypothetical protein
MRRTARMGGSAMCVASASGKKTTGRLLWPVLGNGTWSKSKSKSK